ncbi:MAG: AAA family ATPase [Phycisphaeraceae bacterium]|nr:AAA family ATPase [Phycisphaeraceae bacterium]
MADTAQLLNWDEAPRAIRLRIPSGRVCVIGVTGPVGAGKSHLSRTLRGEHGIHIATDDYLPDYDKVAYEDRDDPDRADSAALIANLLDLRRGTSTRIPTWSFQTHSRVGYREVAPASLVLVEGIHALHERILPHLDLCVFVEAPPEIRWRRWEYLEATGQRGWGVEVAREFFHSVAEPTFAKFEHVYRSRAHFVVRNGAGMPTV